MIRPLVVPVIVCALAAPVAIGRAQTKGGAVDRSPIPLPLTLADAERLLLGRSLSLETARDLVDVAQASRLIAGFKPNPTLQLGAEQIPFASPLPGSVPRFFSTDPNAGAQPTYTVQFAKVIERGGKRELRAAQADENVQSAQFQVLDTQRQLLFQLRQAFANALVARDNLRLAESIVQQYDQTEQLTLVKVRAGDLAPMESYRVRAGRLQYAQTMIDARTTYELATRDVLNLLNASPSDFADRNTSSTSNADTGPSSTPAIEIAGDFTDQPVSRSLEDLREMALQTRPDVQLARHNLLAAERSIDLAQAQRARDVTTSVEYQRVGDDHSVGVVTQVPLFVYNNQRAAISQAEAQRRAAESSLRQVERQAMTDVEKAYQSYLSARQALTLYSTDNIAQVQRLQEIAEFTFRQGSTSLFELLEVQRTTRQALMSYNQARANYQISLWQLEQATGRSIF
jgi:cobalt-zinc-cadmium efflux system outer membrane protein